MKLTPENVAAIEEFLTRRETETDEQIGASLGAHKNTVVQVWSTLRRIGIDMPVRAMGRPRKFERIPVAEAAEFRTWKAAKQANGSAESQP